MNAAAHGGAPPRRIYYGENFIVRRDLEINLWQEARNR